MLVLSLVFSAAAISLLIALSRKPCNANEEEDCDKEVIVHVTRFFGVVFDLSCQCVCNNRFMPQKDETTKLKRNGCL